MKKHNSKILEDHLSIINDMKEVGTDDFFYTRLKARMENEIRNEWSLPLKPIWVIGALMTLLTINSFVISQQLSSTHTNSNSAIQSLATSYDQTISY